MSIEILLTYSLLSFFYVLSPGPAVFLAIANGMNTNLKVVMISSFANILGLFILSSISILGLGALLLSSALLFTIVKVIGALYLIYLGIKQIAISRNFHMNATKKRATPKPLNAYFLESFLLAVTNPKPILFFVAFFPQFLNVEHSIFGQFLILTSIFMTLSFFILMGYGCVAGSFKRVFNKPKFMQWFHRITGGLFIVMGGSLLKLKNS